MISESKQTGDFTFVVISDKGLNHRLNHIPNQDAVMYECKEEDFAIAVSDGVGSCQKSDIGAKSAVEAIRRLFPMLEAGKIGTEKETIADIIIKSWKNLINDENIDDYCATLKAVIKISNELILISIGDGLLAVSSNGISKIAPMENTQFINQTSCLNKNVKSTDFWISLFRLDTYIPYAVFLCTDGVANGITEGQELELVREVETNIDGSLLKEELEKLVVSISEYSMDDRSVGVVKYERKNAKSDR